MMGERQRIGVALVATDRPTAAKTVLGVLSDHDLCLNDATLSTTGGRLFLLATAWADQGCDLRAVEASFSSSTPGAHALIVPLPIGTRERPRYESLTCLLASGPDQPGMLHAIADAICDGSIASP